MTIAFDPLSDAQLLWAGLFLWSAVAAFLSRIDEFVLVIGAVMFGAIAYCAAAEIDLWQTVLTVLSAWIVPQLGYFFGLLAGAGYRNCAAALERWRSPT